MASLWLVRFIAYCFVLFVCLSVCPFVCHRLAYCLMLSVHQRCPHLSHGSSSSIFHFPAFSWVLEEWLAGESCLSVRVFPRYKSLLLVGKWSDRHQTCIRWCPGKQGVLKVKVKSIVMRSLLCCHENRRRRGGLLYVLPVYPAESWAPRVRAHEWLLWLR